MGAWLHRKRFINDKRSTAENDHKAKKEAKLKNLIEQAESEIKGLLDSNMTSYEIGKRSGISNQVIDRYRKGTNIIENMTFKTAKKLLELENAKMGKEPTIK